MQQSERPEHPSASTLERLPRKIGGYRIVRVLGEGARTRVLLGVVPGQRPSALKVPRSAEASRRADAELAVHGHGPLPHSVRLLDVSALDYGVPVLIFERLERGTLAQLLGARRLSPGEIVTVFAPLATALAEIHDLGISHGAIDATHVAFDHRGAPHLLGWGSSAQSVGVERTAAVRHRERCRTDRDHLLALILRSTATDAISALGPPPRGLADFADWLHSWATAVPVRFARPGDDAEAPAQQAESQSSKFVRALAHPRGSGIGQDAGEAAAVMVREALGAPPLLLPYQAPGAPDQEAIAAHGSQHEDAAQPGSGSIFSALLEWPERLWGTVIEFRSKHSWRRRQVASEHRAENAAEHPARRSSAGLDRVRGAWMGLPRRSRLLAVAGIGAAATAMYLLVGHGDDTSELVDDHVGGPGAVGSRSSAGAVAEPLSASVLGADAVLRDDPIAAAESLLELRWTCIREMDHGCLTAVVQPGSAAERADASALEAALAGGEADSRLRPPIEAELVDDYGDSALLSLRRASDQTLPASVLLVRTEAGWRIRAYFDALEN